ncbi:hypothetical protein IKG31_00955 [Candidatus Saccharibacteria bacterium]|nr:hypothetical protein [Candidatus Saccharibacteria bacterium]
MKIKNSYPEIKKKINKFLLIKEIIVIIFAITFITSLIVNLSTGGKLWSIYVLFAEIIFYFAILNRPLIDNVMIRRVSLLAGIVMAYLYTIDKINNTDWSYIVIDILIFSLLIFQLVLFFVNYDHHKNKIIVMLLTSLASCLFCLLAITGVIHINWAIIVTGSIGLFNIIVLFTFYFKTTILEIKKYFNTK